MSSPFTQLNIQQIALYYILACQAHPALVKQYTLKGHWLVSRCSPEPRRFFRDPASLAGDNIDEFTSSGLSASVAQWIARQTLEPKVRSSCRFEPHTDQNNFPKVQLYVIERTEHSVYVAPCPAKQSEG